MTQHLYDSPEYFAQIFRDELKRYFMEKYGGSFPIRHSGNIVSFTVGKISSHVTFDYYKKKPYMFLDMNLKNGRGIERKKSVKTKLDIKRSKTGRISGNYPKFLEDFVLNEIKSFHNKWYA